jgi:2-isopropylmalate synthase
MSVPKYKIPEMIDLPGRQWPTKSIRTSPQWCSVDLRDGNQALPDPMDPEQKLEYFQMLCTIGFKHIEIGFPSASHDEFNFFRRLIEEDLIPDDVFIMGLTQSRPHLIERTLEAFKGCKRGIVHAYIAPSDLHMRQVFGMEKAQLIEMAVAATTQIRELADAMPESDIRYEFSPEYFTDTALFFSL